MDTSKKIIRGVVNSRGFTITSPITQWDYGWQFIPEIEELPPTYRLDFSNEEKQGTALPVYCSTEGAEVPTELIDTGKDVWVWYVAIGDGYGITEYKWRIPNKCKPKTEQDEPTPSQQSSIDQLIVRSNEAVTSAEQSASEAGQSAQSASEDAGRAERARDTAWGYASNAQLSATQASNSAGSANLSAQASAQSASQAQISARTASEKADSIHSMTASAQTLPAGSSATASYDAQTGVMTFGIPKGKDGRDGTNGDDGYSPTANVSKTGKTATITITDKNGTTSAQVEDGEDGIDGISPSVSVTDITGGHRVVITDKDGTKSFDVEDGATGATPNLTIGTVETLEPTDDATATITGTPENPVLNLGIPQGDAGEVTLADLSSALIEKAPIITDTASGSIASFSDGADDLPLKSLIVDINPIQDLSQGDPSPENICPISGWTQINVNHSDADMTNPTTITINLGQTVYGGHLDVLSGVLTVDRAMVDLGTLSWMYDSSSFSSWAFFYTLGLNDVRKPNWNNLVCSNYPLTSSIYARTEDFVMNGTQYRGARPVNIRDSRYTDATAFKSAMNGVQLCYELAEPVEIQLTPNQVNSLLGVNNIWADSGDTEVEYRADTKLFIERLTAPDSADMIADANITSGQYFMVGNSLYKATANIANGSAIVVGTNCIRKSLSEALNEINA